MLDSEGRFIKRTDFQRTMAFRRRVATLGPDGEVIQTDTQMSQTVNYSGFSVFGISAAVEIIDSASSSRAGEALIGYYVQQVQALQNTDPSENTLEM
jgi:hypothetical protein